VLSTVLDAPGQAVSVEHRLRRLDGRTVWVESTLLIEAPRQHPSGEVDEPTLVLLVVDITHRRAQEAALQTSREESLALAEEFRLLAEEVPSGVFRADVGGNIQFANNQFVELAGGRTISHLRELAHPLDQDLVEAARAEVVARHATAGTATDGTVSVEFRSALAGGEMRALRIRVPRTPSGGAVGMIGVLTDLTPTAELRHQARTDPLTGLLNRTVLDDHIADAMEAGRVVRPCSSTSTTSKR
jgi:PAS domain S-box-containing protein